VVLAGGYGTAASAYDASGAPVNAYSTAYPIAGVSGYASYAGGAYESADASAAYDNQYGAYGSASG